MSILTYHILSNPNVLEKLRKELETVFPDPEVLPSCGKVSFLAPTHHVRLSISGKPSVLATMRFSKMSIY